MEFSIGGKKLKIEKSLLIITAVTAAVLAGVIGYLASSRKEQIIIEKNGIAGESTAVSNKYKSGSANTFNKDKSGLASNTNLPVTGQDTEVNASSAIQNNAENKIKIYVTGCVKKPGIVVIDKGQLIDDAVSAAGGFTADADIENINLVYKLEDNIMLKIYPKEKDSRIAAGSSSKAVTGSTAANKISVNKTAADTGKGSEIIRNSGGAVLNEKNGSESQKGLSSININTASLEELDTLPYIGIETAKDIVAFREKNGNFKSVEDIMKVPGIKQSRFNKIKDIITIR